MNQICKEKINVDLVATQATQKKERLILRTSLLWMILTHIVTIYVCLLSSSWQLYSRQKEAMESAKRTYEILNSELHDELPALYDSRVLFLVTNMQTVFAAEEVFHTETAKVMTNKLTFR